MTSSTRLLNQQVFMDVTSQEYRAHNQTRRYWGMGLVIALHVFLVWAALSGTARKSVEALKKPLEAIVIQEIIIPPAPPPPLPKELRLPELRELKIATPVPLVQAEMPVPEAMRSMEILPEPPTASVKPIAILPVPIAPPTLPTENIKVQAASMELEYVGKVRTMLNASKRYPTGRQASQQRPQGKVKVWFTLARSGALIDAGILESSNSNLLDDATLSTVRRCAYPPFPTNTWPGEEHHKFSADIDYLPPSGG